MLLPPRIEVKGRNTPLGIQQQTEEEISSRVSACETTGCASRTGSAESLPPTPSSRSINTSGREDSDEKERKTH
jgi:hypothetical protein